MSSRRRTTAGRRRLTVVAVAAARLLRLLLRLRMRAVILTPSIVPIAAATMVIVMVVVVPTVARLLRLIVVRIVGRNFFYLLLGLDFGRRRRGRRNLTMIATRDALVGAQPWRPIRRIIGRRIFELVDDRRRFDALVVVDRDDVRFVGASIDDSATILLALKQRGHLGLQLLQLGGQLEEGRVRQFDRSARLAQRFDVVFDGQSTHGTRWLNGKQFRIDYYTQLQRDF